MSSTIPPRPRTIVSRKSFVIVAAKFNSEYVQAMVEAATKELQELAPRCKITVKEVPGSFEIPLMVQEMIRSQPKAQAILCLGVILRGATAHADLIARSVTDALMGLSLERRIPVIHEVLLLDNEEQARERCMGEELNRGRDAARAAVEMGKAMESYRIPA